MIRRLLVQLTLATLLFMPMVGLASTQSAAAVHIFGNICTGSNNTGTDASGTDVCGETKKGGNPVVHAIDVVISILSVVIGVAAVVVIILSAFKMIRSGGNPQEVATARNGIIYAAIGLIIAAVSPLLVGYVLTKL